MKKILVLSTVAVLLSALLADAGPLRRLFPRLGSNSCPSGQCETTQAKPVEAFGALPMRALNGKSFAGALQKELAERGSQSLAERRIMRILNSPDSDRRDRQVTRMERHVRVHLDLSPTAAIDWSAINWAELFAVILELLKKLLPLILLI